MPLPKLPARRRDSHKGDYGRALLVGGSSGMAGAIGLAGMAALRGGAGLVTVAVPEAILSTVASYEPSYMTVPLGCDSDGRMLVSAKDRLNELADMATAIGCGPGIGRSTQVTDLITWMYSILPQPMVVDADALFALAHRPDSLEEPAGPRILTPHAGEFRRLAGEDPLPASELRGRAIEFARGCNVVLVLKGHQTLITDGQRSVMNETGNPGMATGGSGDVLTGLITALVCQGLSPFDAACLGAHLHGLAGDLAAAELGQVALIASDLLRYLPAAFRTIEAAS